MKKFKIITVTIVLGGVLLLAACGTSDKASSADTGNNSAASQTTISETKEISDDKGLLAIDEGTKEMKNIIEEMKEGLEDNKVDEVVRDAAELDEVWEKFEDTVKEKSKELYDKAESPLGVIKAGIKIEPLDDETLNDALDNLNKILNDIEKLK